MNNTENIEPQDTFQVPEPEPEYHFVPNIDLEEFKIEFCKLQQYQNGMKHDGTTPKRKLLKPWQGQVLCKDVKKLLDRLAQPKD